MSKLPYFIYLIARVFHRLHLNPIAYFIVFFNRILFGLYLPAEARLGKNVRFGYGGSGVVLHKNCIIGDNVIIGPGVVIGGKSGIVEVPIVGDNCFLAAGCKILGPVILGNNVVVGANAVVVNSFGDGSVVAGMPAKRITK